MYKTTKSSAAASPQCQGRIPTLDSHGCTRDEAIIKLNESLKVWVDTAMKRYHPFVITVVMAFELTTKNILPDFLSEAI